MFFLHGDISDGSFDVVGTIFGMETCLMVTNFLIDGFSGWLWQGLKVALPFVKRSIDPNGRAKKVLS